MDDLDRRAAALHEDALVWDSHVCLPLHPDADLGALERHHASGVDFVSINVGMDMNPLPQIMQTLASFRAQLRARPERFVAVADAGDVLRAKAEGKLAVAFDLEGGVPLGERPEMVQLFYDLGVRQIHLVYNRNNAIGGGCYDDDVPLSDLGRRIVRAINAAGMLMDCSHTGYRTSMDIMALSARAGDLQPRQPAGARRQRPQHPRRPDRRLRRDRRRGLRQRRRPLPRRRAAPARRRSSATSTTSCSGSARTTSASASTTSTTWASTRTRRATTPPTGFRRAHGYGGAPHADRRARADPRDHPRACSRWATPSPTSARSSARTCWRWRNASGARASA